MLHIFIQLNVKILFVLLLSGFLVGKARAAATKNFSQKLFGNFIMDFFNLIGIPVHELGHLLFAVLFGYKIDHVCLFRRMKTAMKSGGTLGYVKMHHEGRTFIRRLQRDIGQFFIGVGPLVTGPALIFILSRFLPPAIVSLPSALRQNISFFFQALQELTGADIIVAFIFLYIIIGISLNMELSQADMEMAFQGILFLELLFLLLSFLTSALGWDPEHSINLLFQWNLMISCIGIIGSLTANLISLI